MASLFLQERGEHISAHPDEMNAPRKIQLFLNDGRLFRFF